MRAKLETVAGDPLVAFLVLLAAGLVATGDGSMSALFGRTTGQRQSPRVHELSSSGTSRAERLSEGGVKPGYRRGERLHRNDGFGARFRTASGMKTRSQREALGSAVGL